MSMPDHRFTYADYCLLPEEKRYELVEGELFMTPAPTVRHQKIHAALFGRLYTFVDVQRLGQVLSAPTDVILSNHDVVQPDVLFVGTARLGILDLDGGLNGAPDLVAEILSPTNSARDQVLKRKLYSKYGVKEYWILDPDRRTVEVLTRVDGSLHPWQVFTTGSALQSPLLPGLAIRVDDLFRD